MQVFKSDKKKSILLDSYNALLKQWDIEYFEFDIHTQYGATHCITAGSNANPPLIMFHGVGDNSAVMWLLNIAGLAKYFYCIAVDTLGGPGKSEPNARYSDDFDQVTWITEVIGQLQLKKPNMVGVSNGACMAYNYLVKQKEKINKVVCIEGGMIVNPLKTVFKTLALVFPEILIPTRKNLLKVFTKLVHPASIVYQKYPDVVEHIMLAMTSHNQSAMFRHKLAKYVADEDSAIRDRMYFLLGDYRQGDKKEFIDILVKGKYKYKIIADAGHGVNHEQAALVNQEIINFLK